MRRRTLLLSTLSAWGGLWFGTEARGATAPLASTTQAQTFPTQRLLAAWRAPLPQGGGQDYVGILKLDWQQRRMTLTCRDALESRPHGVSSCLDGDFLVVAARPGRWLSRYGAEGQLQIMHRAEQDSPERTFDGHVHGSEDGRWLYTTETDPANGAGWLSVRDARTLERVAQWPTYGRDPHQVLSDAQGRLWVANGGIPRTADGDKRDLHLMASSLVCLNADSGELQGQWRLPDRRLSLRHMAWGQDRGQPTGTLGIALQAEHEDAQERRRAPVLAVWNGERLTMPTRSTVAGGYGGDICAGPAGGFVVSGQRNGTNVLWHPDAPENLMTLAQLQEPCALTTWLDPQGLPGILMSVKLGVAQWHPRLGAALLPWPQAMAPDHHWKLLNDGA